MKGSTFSVKGWARVRQGLGKGLRKVVKGSEIT